MSNRNPRPPMTPEDRRQPMQTRAPRKFTFTGCPHCGGHLSDPRLQNGKLWLHCFSCHFEYELEDPDHAEVL